MPARPVHPAAPVNAEPDLRSTAAPVPVADRRISRLPSLAVACPNRAPVTAASRDAGRRPPGMFHVWLRLRHEPQGRDFPERLAMHSWIEPQELCNDQQGFADNEDWRQRSASRRNRRLRPRTKDRRLPVRATRAGLRIQRRGRSGSAMQPWEHLRQTELLTQCFLARA